MVSQQAVLEIFFMWSLIKWFHHRQPKTRTLTEITGKVIQLMITDWETQMIAITPIIQT